AMKRSNEAKSSFEKSSDLYETLLKAEPTSRNYRNEITSACRALSELCVEMKDWKQAEEAMLRAIAILEQTPPDGRADPAYLELVSHVHFDLAQVRARMGRIEEARSGFQDAAKLYEVAFSKRPSAAVIYYWVWSFQELIELPGKDKKAAIADAEQNYRR